MSIIAVTGVTVSPKTSSVAMGATRNLSATVAPANAANKSVNWTTSNPLIATVSGSGVVTPVAAGTCTITVTTVDGSFKDTTALTVTA